MKYVSVDSAISEVIKKAKLYQGVVEGSTLHHKIIDLYNAVTPRPRSYVMTYQDAWCATFVTVVFDISGLADCIYRECGCQEMINGMKKKGLITTSESAYKRGNIVFYDWNGDKHSDHVGIIVSVNAGSKEITVIEGNKNDKVDYRIIPYSYGFIQCIGTPDYKKCVNSVDTYARTGWVEDSKGWWYAYSRTKGSYYKNQIACIDNKYYFFDSNGYLCDASKCTFNEDGSIVEIKGNLLCTH